LDILSSLLAQDTTKESDYDKVFWFVKIMKWVQKPLDLESTDGKKQNTYNVRIKYLLLMLNKNPQWKENFVVTITDLLLKISSVSPLLSVGISSNTSFIQDFIHRLQEKILPASPLSEDLASLLHEVFPNEDESISVQGIDEGVLGELLALFSTQMQLHERLRHDVLTAAFVLSIQLLGSTFAIQNELLDFKKSPDELPEFRIAGILREHQEQKKFNVTLTLLGQLDLAEQNISFLYSEMQMRGVKIDLVYLFESQRRKIRRLRNLLSFFDANLSAPMAFKSFISQIILDIHHQRSLRSFFSENLTLITQRIVQANSEIGEHYVTFTWTEFRQMFRSAMGGGAVTAATVFIKLGIASFRFVGFFKGFLEGLNYAGSFLIIQIMGWTLATKQPSTTAPFIASALMKSMTESRRSIIALLRTQFIAVLGNLSLVFPICFLVSWIALQFNFNIISTEHALEQFSSTYFFGPSAIYAAFTGVLLFLASIFAGWFENWTILNRFEERLMNNERLHRYLGASKTISFAQFVGKNANALAANISLGFLLGLGPQICKFFGVPLEARHITLTTGAFAASLPMVIQHGVKAWDYVNSIGGLVIIGLINISVSFSLAFLLASVSSKVRFSSLLRLLQWGVRLILTRPWLLIVPEKDKDELPS